MHRKLYRSVRNRKVCGLLGGIGEWLGFDVTLLRILFVIATIFSASSLGFVYFIVSLVVPKEPYPPYPSNSYSGGPYSGTSDQEYTGYQGEYYANDQGYYSNPQATNPMNHYSSSSYGGMKQPNHDETSYTSSNNFCIDVIMVDIENKALKKEIEALRQKTSKYERGDN